MTRVYLIAGEPSGDQLGAHLMDGLKTLDPSVTFAGVGGAQMQEQGLDSLFDMSELSVMGILEVLPKLPGLLRRAKQVADDVIQSKPDVLITIDSPDFCLRVAKRVRATDPKIRTVHYVAPSVWAWRPERAAKMARYIDHVLALLPFEPQYMEAAGMTCDFVGHPVAGFPRVSDQAASHFRDVHAISHDAPLLCVLPGSRKSEIAHHAPVFRDILGQLSQDIPGLRTVLPVAPSVADAVENAFRDAPSSPVLLHPDLNDKLAAYAASDAALAVSGTVSLELASQSTPMVIAYTTSALSQWIIRRKFLIDTATLVNLVSDTRSIPEFIFDRFKTELILPEMIALLKCSEKRAPQIAACEMTMELLGRDGDPPGLRAAQSVMRQLP